jgi:GDPmannose 4,6-dehydratase
LTRALITGITGQDGSYLSELLLRKGYEVHGVVRRPVAPVDDRVVLHRRDLTDGPGLVTLLEQVRPDEVYHLAAQTHVRVSFDQPDLTGVTTGLGPVRLLDAIRTLGLGCRFFQASSSEVFGRTAPPPHDEDTPFRPSSPYGAAKAYAHWMATIYRDTYGMFVATGILFNHESPRRGEAFVTRKISRAVARIAVGQADHLELGTLDAVRDWGYAPEYVEAMWRMLQAPEPADFVLATGTAHTVGDFVTAAFEHAGLDWRQHVRLDQQHRRPSEVPAVIGDPRRAADVLGWTAATHAPALARLMVDADVRSLSAAKEHAG